MTHKEYFVLVKSIIRVRLPASYLLCGRRRQMFQQQVAPTQSEVDHCNDLANQFTTDIVLSHRNVARLEDLNRRSVTVGYLCFYLLAG